jgi:hypothetical protein
LDSEHPEVVSSFGPDEPWVVVVSSSANLSFFSLTVVVVQLNSPGSPVLSALGVSLPEGHGGAADAGSAANAIVSANIAATINNVMRLRIRFLSSFLGSTVL